MISGSVNTLKELQGQVKKTKDWQSRLELILKTKS